MAPLTHWPVEGAARGVEPVAPARDPVQQHTDAAWIAARNRWEKARRVWLGDSLPLGQADAGTVSRAAYLGTEPVLTGYTIWYQPRRDAPEAWGPLRLDRDNAWFRIHRDNYAACAQLAGDDFAIGMPGIGSNLEVLAALRGSGELMLDLMDRPAWVEERLWEINAVFSAAFTDFQRLIALPDGSCCSSYFDLWGPGRTSLITLDPVAMISADHFRRFVVPPLAAQCAWLNRSFVHVDGSAALRHLDHLLAIEDLDAVEFTPDPEPDGRGGLLNAGGRKEFIPLYRRILEAGKALQIIEVRQPEVLPLLDALGGKGVNIQFRCADRSEAERLLLAAEAYR